PGLRAIAFRKIDAAQLLTGIIIVGREPSQLAEINERVVILLRVGQESDELLQRLAAVGEGGGLLPEQRQRTLLVAVTIQAHQQAVRQRRAWVHIEGVPQQALTLRTVVLAQP